MLPHMKHKLLQLLDGFECHNIFALPVCLFLALLFAHMQYLL